MSASKISPKQLQALRYIAAYAGPKPGAVSTWKSLVTRGLVTIHRGHFSVTDAGRAELDRR